MKTFIFEISLLLKTISKISKGIDLNLTKKRKTTENAKYLHVTYIGHGQITSLILHQNAIEQTVNVLTYLTYYAVDPNTNM